MSTGHTLRVKKWGAPLGKDGWHYGHPKFDVALMNTNFREYVPNKAYLKPQWFGRQKSDKEVNPGLVSATNNKPRETDWAGRRKPDPLIRRQDQPPPHAVEGEKQYFGIVQDYEIMPVAPMFHSPRPPSPTTGDGRNEKGPKETYASYLRRLEGESLRRERDDQAIEADLEFIVKKKRRNSFGGTMGSAPRATSTQPQQRRERSNSIGSTTSNGRSSSVPRSRSVGPERRDLLQKRVGQLTDRVGELNAELSRKEAENRAMDEERQAANIAADQAAQRAEALKAELEDLRARQGGPGATQSGEWQADLNQWRTRQRLNATQQRAPPKAAVMHAAIQPRLIDRSFTPSHRDSPSRGPVEHLPSGAYGPPFLTPARPHATRLEDLVSQGPTMTPARTPAPAGKSLDATTPYARSNPYERTYRELRQKSVDSPSRDFARSSATNYETARGSFGVDREYTLGRDSGLGATRSAASGQRFDAEGNRIFGEPPQHNTIYDTQAGYKLATSPGSPPSGRATTPGRPPPSLAATYQRQPAAASEPVPGVCGLCERRYPPDSMAPPTELAAMYYKIPPGTRWCTTCIAAVDEQRRMAIASPE